MKGSDLRKAVNRDKLGPNKRTAKEVAAAFGISRNQLYEIFRYDEVPPQYIKKAQEIGLEFNDPKPSSNELEFLKKQIELLQAHLEDVKREAETYRILLTNMTESKKAEPKKVKP